MKHEVIDALLERYWDASTTLEEERQLKHYFSGKNIAPHHKELAPLFVTLQKEQAITLVQAPAPILYAAPMQVVHRRKYANRGRWLAAASVAGLLSCGLWWMYSGAGPTNGQLVNVVPPVLEHDTRSASVQKNIEAPVTIQLPATSPVKKKLVRSTPTSIRSVAVKQNPKEVQDTELALEEVKAALSLVSRKLNRSKKEAARHLNQIEQIDILNKDKKEG